MNGSSFSGPPDSERRDSERRDSERRDSEGQTVESTSADGELSQARWLAWFLLFIGIVSQLAFVAAVMPEKWIIEITEELKLEPFPETPLAFYLARHLSLIYGFIGLAMIVISSNVLRYRELIRYLAIGVISFGILQGWIDHQSGMPIWWTASESVSTTIGGVLMMWLERCCLERH